MNRRIRGQDHWPRLHIGTCGQRLKPLNSSAQRQCLPEACTHPEDHLKRGGNQYEKYIACNLCFERWLRIDVQEPQSSTEAPEPPAASAASSMRPREQLPPAFRNWRACILGP